MLPCPAPYLAEENRIANGVDMELKKKITTALKEDLHKIAKARWTRHQDHAVGDAKRFLSKSDIIAITLLSISAAFLITFIDFLIYLRWSTFNDGNLFKAYHPYVPMLLILFNLIFLFCLYAKRVSYWLAYYPAILGIIYYSIEASLIYGMMQPQDLQNFFTLIGLGNPPGWLIGI
jgi:hypothetical protein